MILYQIEELNNKLSKANINDLLEASSIPFSEELLLSEDYAHAFKIYLLLSYSVFFSEEDPVKVFYNRYYWFLTFVEKYKIVNKNDAGLDQQVFKLLEDADEINGDIDWGIIEQLNNQVINISLE